MFTRLFTSGAAAGLALALALSTAASAGAAEAAVPSVSASPSTTSAKGAPPPAEAPAVAASAVSSPPGEQAASVPPKSSSASSGADGATYAVRLRDLEQRIDDVKEQIRRSHTRLSLLSETLLAGGAGGARASIRFVNELSSAFKVTRALFVLDGAVQYNKMDSSGALAEQSEIPIFSGAIPPGDHSLQILVTLQGNGYGVFSYLKGYKFEVRSSHSFTVVEGKNIDLQVVGYEKGGVTTELAERPAIRYLEKAVAPSAEPDAVPAAGGK